MNKEASRMRSEEVKQAVPKGENQWSDYPQHTLDPVNKARQAQKLT